MSSLDIPAHSDPVKYEVDKATGAMFVDRFMNTSMHYPCNHGYIPHSLSEDGDPVDVLVVTPVPLISGSVIQCRPISVLNMTDESGPDAKILAVPIDRLSTQYRHVDTLDELPPGLPASIAHFFDHYKDLEANKWVRIDGWTASMPPARKSCPASSASRTRRSSRISRCFSFAPVIPAKAGIQP